MSNMSGGFGKRRAQPLDAEMGRLTHSEEDVVAAPLTAAGDSAVPPTSGPRSTISPPAGRWRDSLWSYCRYGPFHASVWNSICCCALTGAGQVASRLQLTYAGQVGTASQAVTAFHILARSTIAFWTTRAIILVIIAILDPNIDSTHWIEPSRSYYFWCAVDDLLAYIYFGFTVICLRNMRSHVRQRYAIPEDPDGYCCQGCEDTCCSIFCPCLVVAQLLRHTTDYDVYPGRCCSATGLPSTAPAILV